MLKTPILTDDQVQQFSDDGFLVLRGGFSADDMAIIAG